MSPRRTLRASLRIATMSSTGSAGQKWRSTSGLRRPAPGLRGRPHPTQLAAHEHPSLNIQAVPRLLLANRPHARRPLRELQVPEPVLSVERPVPRHVAEGREGDRRVALRVCPRADRGEQAGPEPAPAMPWQDVHLLDVHGPLPHRSDHHAHGEAVLQAAHPDLPHTDEAGQVVLGERHVERLIDEPEAREDRARLILDLPQARDLVREGEANPVGIWLLVHGDGHRVALYTILLSGAPEVGGATVHFDAAASPSL